MKEVTLPSGALLRIGESPFEDSKDLYQAILDEAKMVKIDVGSVHVMSNVYKDLFCYGFSSKRVEACLWKLFERCLYEGHGKTGKIDKDTFQPKPTRADYIAVCVEVAKENIDPFLKGLFAEYEKLFQEIEKIPQ